jgi:hypothetical protein
MTIQLKLHLITHQRFLISYSDEVLTLVLATIDLTSISDRMAIRTAIQTGNVDEGIARVNELTPSVSLQRDCIRADCIRASNL